MAKTINTVLKLKDEFSKGIKTAASSTKMLSTQTKITEARAKKLATAMKAKVVAGAKMAAKALAAMGVAAAAAAKKLAESTASQLDTIDKQSQKMHISSTAYQEWDYALARSGTDISVLKTGMKTLTTQMAAAQEGTEDSVDAFNQLGVNVTDSNGELRSQEDILKETIKGLADMSNEADRTALATQLFGKAGTELAPLLNSGSEGIQEMLDRCEELGLVVDGDTVKAGAHLQDTMDDVKDSLSRVALSVGSEMIPYFQSFSEYLLDHLPQIRKVASKVAKTFATVGKKIGELYKKFRSLSPTVQKFLVLVGPVTVGVVKMVAGVKKAITVFKQIKQTITVLKGAMNLLALGPIALIAAGIAAVIVVGVLLYKNWDKIKAKAQQLKAKITELWNKFLDGHPAIAKIVEIVKSFWRAVQTAKNKVQSLINKLKEWFSWNGKKVNVYQTTHKSTSGATHSGDGGNFATGTNYAPGGTTLVGEHGPELLSLPKGSKVDTKTHTESLLKSSAPTINVSVNVQGNVIGNESYANELGNIISKKLISAMGNV